MTGYVLVAIAVALTVGAVPLAGCWLLDRVLDFHAAGLRRLAPQQITSPDDVLEQQRQHARLIHGRSA